MAASLIKVKSAFKEFTAVPVMKKFEMLSFFFLCIFFFDCSILGGGRIFEIGPLTSRMLFAFLAILFSLPAFFKNFKRQVTNPINLMLVGFAVYLVICAVRGISAGNRMDVLMSDIKGFAWLALVPFVLKIVNDKPKFSKLVSVITAGAVIQAIFVICLNWFCAIVPDGIKLVYQPLMDSSVGTISNISHIIFRIFMKSSPYLAFALGVAVFRQLKIKKLSVKYVSIFVLCAYALLLSFTRSVYGCVFVVLGFVIAFVVVFKRDSFLDLVKYLAVAFAVFLAFNYVQEFAFKANYMNFAISRTFNTQVVSSPIVKFRYVVDGWLSGGGGGGDSDDTSEQEKYLQLTDDSDNIRAKTKADLKALIVKNPIFGNGLGASAQSREDGLDEYFYLDVLARMGIVGLLLYVLPFGYVLLKMFLERKRFVSWHDSIGTLCGMCGFWAVTWFNPWMNAVLGIACYALICSVIPINDKEKQKESF